MPPIEGQELLDEIFEGHFWHAMGMYRDGNFKDARMLSDRMLLDPRVGDMLRAGFHVIVAVSGDDNFSEHIERAVDLYERVPDGAGVNKLNQQVETLLEAEAAIRKLKDGVGDVVNEEPEAVLNAADSEGTSEQTGLTCDAKLREGESREGENKVRVDQEDEAEAKMYRAQSDGIDIWASETLDWDVEYPSEMEGHMVKDFAGDFKDYAEGNTKNNTP